MAVGGFFFDSEPFRTASGPVSGATGQTFRTALKSGLRGQERRVGRPSTPARRRRAPGRLEQPRGPRAEATRPRTGAVGVVAVRSARTASRGSERSTSTPSTRRVRRRATPRLCWLQRRAVPCGATGQTELSSVGSRCEVLPAPLRLSGDRCGSVASIALCCCSNAGLSLASEPQHCVSIDSG